MKHYSHTVFCQFAFALLFSSQQLLASEVLLVCRYDSFCNSAGACQPLKTPKENKLCATLSQNSDLQGVTIWGEGLTPMSGGSEGNVSAYSGFLSYQPNPKEQTVMEWKDAGAHDKEGNVITIFLDSLAGGAVLYFGDPRVDTSMSYYTGYWMIKQNQPCEVPN